MGDERFALDTTNVVEVIPVVSLKRLPEAPEWVAGIMRYRGRQAPVIDICALSFTARARRLLSTRIIMVKYNTCTGEDQLLGLMAERVTDTLHCNPDQFVSTGVRSAPYLGKVLHTDDGLLQLVHCDSLLSDAVQAILYQPDPVVDHVL